MTRRNTADIKAAVSLIIAENIAVFRGIVLNIRKWAKKPIKRRKPDKRKTS